MKKIEWNRGRRTAFPERLSVFVLVRQNRSWRCCVRKKAGMSSKSPLQRHLSNGQYISLGGVFVEISLLEYQPSSGGSSNTSESSPGAAFLFK